MIIGIPRERKTLEKRIALTPDGAQDLVKRGHEVLIETNAGVGSHFADEEFAQVGCKIVSTLKEVWSRAELVVKVKEPHEEEYQYFRPGLAIFDYLHLASMADLTRTMLKGKVTGIAYELVQTADGRLPLLEPMSEVAGKLSVLNGSYYLLSQNGGRGVLLGGTIGVRPGNVVIVGAGVAGRCACEVAVGMGASVTVMDISYRKLEALREIFGSRIKTLHSTHASLERECEKADLVIGAVLVPGAAAPHVLTRQMIKSMNRGAVFVDISVDQGGCSETTKVTSLATPTFELDGVIHYCVPNMPAQTPRTSTMALTAATLPWVIKIAQVGVAKALKDIKEIREALNVYQGFLTNKAVGEAVAYDYTPIEEALTQTSPH